MVPGTTVSGQRMCPMRCRRLLSLHFYVSDSVIVYVDVKFLNEKLYYSFSHVNSISNIILFPHSLFPHSLPTVCLFANVIALTSFLHYCHALAHARKRIQYT